TNVARLRIGMPSSTSSSPISRIASTARMPCSGRWLSGAGSSRNRLPYWAASASSCSLSCTSPPSGDAGAIAVCWPMDIVVPPGGGRPGWVCRRNGELAPRLAAQCDDADGDQRAEQSDAPPDAQCVRGSPEDEQQDDAADCRPGEARTLVEHRRHPPASGGGGTRRAGEDRAPESDDAVEDRGPPDLREALRASQSGSLSPRP